jgi:hypothetical protein
MSKAQQIQKLFLTGASDALIAQRVHCHQGYVRAVRMRWLQPERELARWREDNQRRLADEAYRLYRARWNKRAYRRERAA